VKYKWATVVLQILTGAGTRCSLLCVFTTRPKDQVVGTLQQIKISVIKSKLRKTSTSSEAASVGVFDPEEGCSLYL
jgi:predicted transcriptional regulator